MLGIVDNAADPNKIVLSQFTYGPLVELQESESPSFPLSNLCPHWPGKKRITERIIISDLKKRGLLLVLRQDPALSQ